MPSNKFLALMNGKSWFGESEGGHLVDSLFGFYVLVRNSQGFERESFGVGNIPRKPGKYPLIFSKWDRSKIICGYSTSVDDGDVGCDAYYVFPGDSATNVIEVTEIKNNMATGNFNVTLLRDRRSDGTVCDPSKPDTIRFTEGYFKINIGKKYQ